MENNTVAPTDYDTLREMVEDLRTHAYDDCGERYIPTHIGHQAAEAITQLQAKVERLEVAAKTLGTEAALLLQNSEGCAQNHYGTDCQQFGMPQWLVDSRARIESARDALGRTE